MADIQALQDQLENALRELKQVKQERDELLKKQEGVLNQDQAKKVLYNLKKIQQDVYKYEKQRLEKKQKMKQQVDRIKLLFGSSIEELIPYQLNSKGHGLNRYKLLFDGYYRETSSNSFDSSLPTEINQLISWFYPVLDGINYSSIEEMIKSNRL